MQIKCTPFKMIDLVNPGLEFSVEKKYSNKWSTQLSAAWLHNFFNTTALKNFKGFTVGVEEKRFVKKKDPYKAGNPYIALQFMYYNSTYNDVARFGVKSRYQDSIAFLNNYVDSFGVRKQTASLNFKFGVQIPMGENFLWDFSFGVGLKYKDVVHTDRLKPNDDMESPRHFNAYYMASLPGKYVTVNIPFNIKLGVSF
jgi:hypothetical protein